MSRAGTRSRPAATGSSAIAGSAWSRCRAAASSSSPTRSLAASIPRNYIPAVEKGIVEAAAKGFLAGYPVVDFKVTVYDGSYHDVDSSEMAFKLAARKAFKAAMQKAKPALLEPVMNVEVQAPVEFAGDLMGDMNSRRGRISGHGDQGQHADHPRAGADVGDAELPERSDFHDAGPGFVPHGVRPLRLRAGAAGG